MNTFPSRTITTLHCCSSSIKPGMPWWDGSVLPRYSCLIPHQHSLDLPMRTRDECLMECYSGAWRTKAVTASRSVGCRAGTKPSIHSTQTTRYRRSDSLIQPKQDCATAICASSATARMNSFSRSILNSILPLRHPIGSCASNAALVFHVSVSTSCQRHSFHSSRRSKSHPFLALTSTASEHDSLL